jgi:5-methylcytosine-specific restriction endonuclease McrA
VFERDDWTCQKCAARNGNGKAIYLEAHHLKPFTKYPELRFELDDGTTLCRGCHVGTFLQ